MGPFKERRLRRSGIEAVGEVLTATPLHSDPESAVVPYRLRLLISDDGRDAREIELKATAGRDVLLGPGTRLVVRVDPKDPGEIAIDWDASRDLLRAEGVPGLEGTPLGSALGKVIADGRKAKPEDIEGLLDAARRSAEPGPGG